MWPTRSLKLNQISKGLSDFSLNVRALPGIADPAYLQSLAMQMIASLRRLDYTRTIKARDISADRCDPMSNRFDPERAAAYFARNGNRDEAIWLVPRQHP